MIKVGIDELKHGMLLARSIVGESGELLLSTGNVVNDKVIAKMREIELSSCWIVEEGTEHVIPEESIDEQLALQSQFVVQENADILKKVAQIKDVTHANITKILEDTSRFKNIITVEAIKKIIKQIMDDLLKKDPVAVNLSSIRTKSGYLYQHSLDVTLTAIILASKLKCTYKEIEDIALGCLLMDVGMVVFPDSLMSKEGSFSEEEATMYREHPSLGNVILSQNTRLPSTAAHVAYEHHERQDGMGYPRGLLGDNQLPLKSLLPKAGYMHRFSEIAIIADAYISLMFPKPNTAIPLSPDEVMRTLIKGAGTHFNRAIIDAFITIVPVFPVGCRVVIIEDKKYRKFVGFSGVVTLYRPHSPEQPNVLLIFDRNKTKIKPLPLDISVEVGFKIQFERLL